MEQGISIPFEHDTTFDPALAAGAGVIWTNERLIHNQWLLVIGFGADEQPDEAQRRCEAIVRDLKTMLGSVELASD